MNDWQAGDQAVFIGGDGCGCHKGTADNDKHVGTILRVVSVSSTAGERCTAPCLLTLAAYEHVGAVCCLVFRKIHPDEREACEPEFITLLKRSKRKVSA